MNIQQEKVRVRFAPSPTGHLHIGSFRTALFNYLFARHHNGTYLLRIEDTDIERSKKEYTDSIEQSLAWARLLPDEPFVIQSSRIKEHQQLITELLNQKKAYKCYCTQEEIVERYQKTHDTQDTFIKYDGKCFQIIEQKNLPFVVRFKILDNFSTLSFLDLIRGTITVHRDQLDDFIIARSDGTPTYNFVVVADDAFMRITHVIRGDDHIANTPKQILLYNAFGYTAPHFAHIPLILGPEGNKLSKRDATTSVVEYIKDGYLPDAFVNYLARLGWSHGDQEIFSRQELIEFFSLDAVGKKGAIFDQDKLNWINGIFIRALSAHELYDYLGQYLFINFVKETPLWDQQTVYKLIDLYKERCKTVKELSENIIALYTAPIHFLSDEINKWITPEVCIHLQDLIKKLEENTLFTVDVIKSSIKSLCTDRNLKLVMIAQPIRIALVGNTSSPGIFELLEILGKKESIQRLRSLLHYVSMM